MVVLYFSGDEPALETPVAEEDESGDATVEVKQTVDDNVEVKQIVDDNAEVTEDITQTVDSVTEAVQSTASEKQESATPEDVSSLEIVSQMSDMTLTRLEVGSREQVTVGHVDSPSVFYISPEQNKAKGDALLEEMFEFYSNQTSGGFKLESPTEGKVKPHLSKPQLSRLCGDPIL